MPSEYAKESESDRALMEGLTFLEQSIEPDTGYPSWLTHGRDALGAFEAKPGMNYAREAIEKARKSEKDAPAGREWRLERSEGS